MKKKNPPSHGSFYGIQKVVYKDDFLIELNNRIDYATLSSFSKHPVYGKKYNSVKIIDTFLTGFEPNTLKKIIHNSFEKKYNIQILLLNPFSALAKLRNEVLSKNNRINHIVRLNNGLHKIIKAFKGDVDQSNIMSGDLDLALNNYNEIQKLADEYDTNLKLKFTSQFTDFPIYIISEFAMKGHILQNEAAENNPWIFSVDDPIQKDDIYDTFLRNFKNLWEYSSNLKEIINRRDSINFYKKDEVVKLKRLVENNLIREVLEIINEILMSKFSDSSSFYNDFITLSSQWDSFINKAYFKGVLHNPEISVEEAKIKNAILMFIDKININ